jgi:hypothetical protein
VPLTAPRPTHIWHARSVGAHPIGTINFDGGRNPEIHVGNGEWQPLLARANDLTPRRLRRPPAQRLVARLVFCGSAFASSALARLDTAAKGNRRREMAALDDTLREKVEKLVDTSRQPLRWTSSTTVVIAQLVERIEALEEALREIADAVSAVAATDADDAATERRSGDHLQRGSSISLHPPSASRR